MPFFENNYFYIITILLQGICVWHCIRTGRQNNWLWLIIFLPIIGCVIYFFSEIVTRREVSKVESGFSSVFNPNGRIRQLENNLRFSDAFENKVALADAYFQAGQLEKAVNLYVSSLQGNFEENEHVLSQLILCYFNLKRYADIPPLAKRIYKRPQFSRSRAHIFYAVALDHIGRIEEAEAEFRTMKARFSNFEARYQYGLFLVRRGRNDEAKDIFRQMIDETGHLSPQERRYNRRWIDLAKEELKRSWA